MASDASTFSITMPTALPLGAVVGQKYRIDEVIAEGGMGIVYKGWHLILEHPIAIKVVRPEFAHHPEAAARFVNEARVSAQLHGIHSTHVLDLGRIENGPPIMVLEYLEGCDLRRVLAADGPLPLTRAVDYVLQTCEAVAEAHAQGIVHRDLKPDNLFVQKMPDGTEILKVIDFGISKRLGLDSRSRTQQSQSFGSPDYMAPEQMSSPDQVDERADIWSIGVVLFELLTNCVPFRSETVQSICVKVMSAEPVPLLLLRPDLPVELEQTVLRCLCKAREGRYPNVGELAQELVPFASPEAAPSYERVRRLLRESEADSAPISAMRVLAWHAPSVRDETPVPPLRHETTDVDLRLPMHPLWPVALGIAAAALLLMMSMSDPQRLRMAAFTAAGHVQTVARTGARTVSGMASAAAAFVESETFGAEPKPGSVQAPPVSASALTGDDALVPTQPVEALHLVEPTAHSRPVPPPSRGSRAEITDEARSPTTVSAAASSSSTTVGPEL